MERVKAEVAFWAGWVNPGDLGLQLSLERSAFFFHMDLSIVALTPEGENLTSSQPHNVRGGVRVNFRYYYVVVLVH